MYASLLVMYGVPLYGVLFLGCNGLQKKQQQVEYYDNSANHCLSHNETEFRKGLFIEQIAHVRCILCSLRSLEVRYLFKVEQTGDNVVRETA